MRIFGRWAQHICLHSTLLRKAPPWAHLPPAARKASWLYTRLACMQAHSNRQRHPAHCLLHPGAAACGLGGWIPLRLPPGATPAPCGLRAQRERRALGHAGRAGRRNVHADVHYACAANRGGGGLLTRRAVHAGRNVRPAGPLGGPSSLYTLQQWEANAGWHPGCLPTEGSQPRGGQATVQARRSLPLERALPPASLTRGCQSPCIGPSLQALRWRCASGALRGRCSTRWPACRPRSLRSCATRRGWSRRRWCRAAPPSAACMRL